MHLWTATRWVQIMQYPDNYMPIIAVKTPTSVLYITGVMLQVGINTSGSPNILVIGVRDVRNSIRWGPIAGGTVLVGTLSTDRV